MFAVHPDEAVYAFQSLKRTTINGLNVTIPLKGKAFEAADKVTPDAEKLGVCNLLYKRDDLLIGHNTDMEGFAGPLLKHIGHNFVLNNAVTVVGAGGAARAALGALLAIGAPEIRLINRTDERSEALVTNINVPNLYAMPWKDRQQAVRNTGLLINASSAGMKNKNHLDISVSQMSENGWIYDLVYTPLETLLLKKGKQAGLNTLGGLEMLIEQARPSFRYLFGADSPRNCQVESLLIEHLEGLAGD